MRDIDPQPSNKAAADAKSRGGTPDFSDVDAFVAEQEGKDNHVHMSPYAMPDMPLIALRLVAATALSAAAFVGMGLVRRPQKRA